MILTNFCNWKQQLPTEFIEEAEIEQNQNIKLKKRKIKNIDSINPDIVASSCPGCILQILDLASQNNKSYKVKHVIELLAENM